MAAAEAESHHEFFDKGDGQDISLLSSRELDWKQWEYRAGQSTLSVSLTEVGNAVWRKGMGESARWTQNSSTTDSLWQLQATG